MLRLTVLTGLPSKRGHMGLPFTDETGKILFIVFGHYNVILQTEVTDFVPNMKSRA